MSKVKPCKPEIYLCIILNPFLCEITFTINRYYFTFGLNPSGRYRR